MILSNLQTRTYILTPVKLKSCRYTHIKLKMSPPPPTELVIYGASMEVVNNCRLLGVTTCDTLDWLPKCEKVANKLRSVTHMFTILRDTYTVSESYSL
jgi:hypothetical protein